MIDLNGQIHRMQNLEEKQKNKTYPQTVENATFHANYNIYSY